MPEMGFERSPNYRSEVGWQPSEVFDGLWRKDDSESHSGQNMARMVERQLTAFELLSASKPLCHLCNQLGRDLFLGHHRPGVDVDGFAMAREQMHGVAVAAHHAGCG